MQALSTGIDKLYKANDLQQCLFKSSQPNGHTLHIHIIGIRRVIAGTCGSCSCCVGLTVLPLRRCLLLVLRLLILPGHLKHQQNGNRGP